MSSLSGIYGDEFLVYNVHNLIHLADEILRVGPIDVFSCAPFENHIGVLTRLVQHTNRALAQLAKRIIERRNHNINKPFTFQSFRMYQPHNNGPTFIGFSGSQFKKLRYNNMYLSLTAPDNCVVLRNGDVFKIYNIIQTQRGEMLLYGRILLPIRSLYLYPMDSKLLGIFVVQESLLEFEYFPIEHFYNKAIKIPIPHCENEFAIVPFLHVDQNSE